MYFHYLVTGFLRTTGSIAANTDEDERAGLSVPVAEKLKTWFTSSKVTPKRLQSWLNKGKSAETVFTRMQLTKAGSWLFYDSQFPTWLQYVDDLNAKTSQKGTSAISALTAQYGDDALYKMIVQAKIISRTKDLATKLQADQAQHWVAIRKDPDEVFHLFKLDKVKRNILSNPEFTAWVKYVDDVSTKHPEEPVSMIPALRKYFNDDTLLELTATAKRTEETKSIANKVEDDLLQVWLGSRKTPDEALVELGLCRTTNGILESPLFNTLTKYLDAYNERYPDKTTSVIETITRKVGDRKVAKILTAAKSTDATKNIATKLESAQLEMWQSTGKSADDIFELLKLRKTRHDFSHNPLLRTWVSYMNVVVTENPNKMSTLFSTLETRFSDRPMLQILEAAKKFPNREKSPSDAFRFLYLNNAGEQTLASPKFKTWAKYLNDFNQRYPDRKETMIDGIRTNYIDINLIPMLYAAQKDPRTKKLAINLQNALVNKCLVAKEKPADLTWRFSTVTNAEEMIQRYVKKLD
ncbi:hypothetical protein JG687_00019335, partial [Phytophthora cactorum]